MSYVTYNGVALPYPLHSSFSMDTVYDDSGTDWMYTKISAMVQCLISADYISVVDPNMTAGIDVIQMGRVIRAKLLQPRRKLSISIGTRNLVPQEADVTGTVDARNGPTPRSCTITQMTDLSFLVTFHVEANYWENYPSQAAAEGGINRKGNTVISNRWSDSQEIDAGKYSHRIREGKVVIRSDNAEGLTVDDIRQDFAVFGLADGFVRKRASFRIHPDGLSMTYRLDDQEPWIMPPPPAYEADGYYTESTTNNGALRWGECQVTLKGAKDVPKGELLRRALVVMMDKLETANSNVVVARGQRGEVRKVRIFHPLGILASSIIRTALYENNVTVSARFMLDPNGKVSIQGVGTIDANTLASKPFGSEGAPAPSFTTRGTAGLALKAAQYFIPSLQQKIDQTKGMLSEGTKVGTAGVNKETNKF